MKFFNKLFVLMAVCAVTFAKADTDDLLLQANALYNSAVATCGDLSSQISHISGVSIANTVVDSIGTASATGALVVGIERDKLINEIYDLQKQICDMGGCDEASVNSMTDEEFFNNVIIPFSNILEKEKLLEQQKQLDTKAKKLGNWRTGLLAGTVGTNIASAVMSGLNMDQSELIQQITVCNNVLQQMRDINIQLKQAGVNPYQNPIVSKINNTVTWCLNLDIQDIEKIEKRMKAVLGTSIAGSVIGTVGVATSAAANSDKIRTDYTTEGQKKEKDLNITANVMAGANIATGAVETGLNISMITLTKRILKQQQQCEMYLK